jgi:hypothetical protein
MLVVRARRACSRPELRRVTAACKYGQIGRVSPRKREVGRSRQARAGAGWHAGMAPAPCRRPDAQAGVVEHGRGLASRGRGELRLVAASFKNSPHAVARSGPCKRPWGRRLAPRRRRQRGRSTTRSIAAQEQDRSGPQQRRSVLQVRKFRLVRETEAGATI